MKGKLKRSIALILCLLLLVSAISACGGGNQASEGNGSTQAASASQTTEAPKGPPVELKIEVFERGAQGYAPANDNYWTKWINENFGKPNNINVTFVPVQRTEEVNKLNVLMAANEAPDLVFTYNSGLVANYAVQGGIQDVTPYLEKYGQNIKSFVGKEALDYGIFNGKQYSIPGKRVILGIIAYHIRQDWLDKVGMTVPKTTAEFYDTMKAFKEKDPGGLGDKNIPYGITMNNGYGYYGMLMSFIEKMTEEEWYTYFPVYLAMPGYKEGMRFLNKLYNEGLVSPEFAIDKDSKKLQADISNGQVGFFSANLGAYLKQNLPIVTTLVKNNPSASYVACDPFVNSEGKKPKYGNLPIGIYNMIPTSSKRGEEVVKYLDWMTKPEVLKVLQNGFEGETYSVRDGIPIPNDYSGEKKLYVANNSDFTPIVNGRYFGDDDLNAKAESMNCPGFEQLFLDTYKVANTDMVTEPYFRGLVNEPRSKYTAQLATKMEEAAAKLTLCKPSEFDKLYEVILEDYLKSGAQEIIDQNKKLYQELKK